MPNISLKPPAKDKPTKGQRLAHARDKSSIYTISQDESISEKEREEMRRVLKERFTIGARPMPTTLQGLTSLANERIEDAIARGQFKNIPRGKGTNVERDHAANSPFLDTTEYFMNKIIQKQDIVPPWIEKQQELIKEADTFRKRLRSEWRRHAARMIASQGGSLESQIARAKGYAAAEERLNPRRKKQEVGTRIDSDGRITKILPEDSQEDETVTVEAQPTLEPTTDPTAVPTEPLSQSQIPVSTASDPILEPSANEPEQLPIPNLAPFRDPDWLRLESAYHTLALQSLNNLARSYNLMAPRMAQKPYYNLDRELNSMYAEVAPLLAQEIENRARAPPERVLRDRVGHKAGGVMEKFGAGERVPVWDERSEKAYGFKEFWKDLWG